MDYCVSAMATHKRRNVTKPRPGEDFEVPLDDDIDRRAAAHRACDEHLDDLREHEKPLVSLQLRKGLPARFHPHTEGSVGSPADMCARVGE
jgi:hypothetical protein